MIRRSMTIAGLVAALMFAYASITVQVAASPLAALISPGCKYINDLKHKNGEAGVIIITKDTDPALKKEMIIKLVNSKAFSPGDEIKVEWSVMKADNYPLPSTGELIDVRPGDPKSFQPFQHTDLRQDASLNDYIKRNFDSEFTINEVNLKITLTDANFAKADRIWIRITCKGVLRPDDTNFPIELVAPPTATPTPPAARPQPTPNATPNGIIGTR
jgi:hypothetical protein